MERRDLEKCLCQLLMSHGFVNEETLIHQLHILNKHTIPNLPPLSEYFASINRRLRAATGLEIKSVNLVDAQGRRVLYHGIVNVEEDFVAKKWGEDLVSNLYGSLKV